MSEAPSRPVRGRPRQTHCHLNHPLPETGRRDCKICDRLRKQDANRCDRLERAKVKRDSSPEAAAARADAMRKWLPERMRDEATVTRILAEMDRREEMQRNSRLQKRESHNRRLIGEYAPGIDDESRDEAASLLSKLKKLNEEEKERLLRLLLRSS